jgi:hypothetical protein
MSACGGSAESEKNDNRNVILKYTKNKNRLYDYSAVFAKCEAPKFWSGIPHFQIITSL